MVEKYLTSSRISQYKLSSKDAIDLIIIENPECALTDRQKDSLPGQLEAIMQKTTGLRRTSEQVRRYAFGIADRGRTLCLLEKDAIPIGFVSYHLINTDGTFVRDNGGNTIIHTGSGHILPEYQGRNYVLSSFRYYCRQLPDDLKPGYLSGLTQSPRLLHLINTWFKDVYPTTRVDNPFIPELRRVQELVLPIITQGLGQNLSINLGCKVSGISDDRVYAKPIYSHSDYDDLVYKQLQLKEGDFIHFIARTRD